MFLLSSFSLAIENKDHGSLMADWLQDNRSNDPEVHAYIKWLREKKFTPAILIDVIAKYGDKNERHLIRKAVSKTINSTPNNKWNRRLLRRGSYYLPYHPLVKTLIKEIDNSMKDKVC